MLKFVASDKKQTLNVVVYIASSERINVVVYIASSVRRDMLDFC